MHRLPPARSTRLIGLGLGLGLLALTGCTPIVAMEAAGNATSVDCAEVSVRLPRTIDELPRRETNAQATAAWGEPAADRKSTRLNSSHVRISYAVFCLKKKKKKSTQQTHTVRTLPTGMHHRPLPLPRTIDPATAQVLHPSTARAATVT